MWWIIGKQLVRITWVVLLLSIITFQLIQKAPFNAIEQELNQNIKFGLEQKASYRLAIIRKKIRENQLDLPVFFFSLQSLAIPYQKFKESHYGIGEAKKRFYLQSGNSTLTDDYFARLETVIDEKPWAYELLFEPSLEQHIRVLNNNLAKDEWLHFKSFLNDAKDNKVSWKALIPVVYFYPRNQYGIWLFGNGRERKGAIRGDFGTSLVRKQNVWKLIMSRLPISALFSVGSLFFILFFSLGMGIFMATNAESALTSFLQKLLIALHGIPNFWMGSILVLLFANPYMWELFPASGLEPINGFTSSGFFATLAERLPYLVLPFICYIYGGLAVLTSLVESDALKQCSALFVSGLKSRGVAVNRVVWIHVLKNSLIPLLALAGGIFPAILGGSVIIETIFSIPGMGQLAVQASRSADYPVIMALVVITGILSMMGYFVSDWLLQSVDPRIKIKDFEA